MNFAQFSRTVWWLGLIFCVGLTARAQVPPSGTVIPTVCFASKPETLTRTATGDFNNTYNFINLNQAIPDGFYALVINPGGTTQERLTYVRTGSSQTLIHPGGNGLPSQTFAFDHFQGETLLLIAEGDAVFGYKNTSSTAVTLTRGGSSSNSFSPGNIVYPSQPGVFQPGVHENVVRIKVLAAFPVTWRLNSRLAASNTTQRCATITYQGRLSDGNAAANGQFDLQFQAFETETGGAAQSELTTLENVPVTNGIFTVPLFFGATLTDNYKAQFLEIGVRPGVSTGAFTTLTPRQPLTQVPFAVNAQTAQTAFDVRLQLTTNAPPAAECNETSEHGQMRVDATNNRLWICTATGWKSTVLQ